ncbi:MAG: peptidoglycan DD-metalloendopeptidase family protein, partial [Gammaproteobacteria bacterium]|nr:peptidoglycan DD-metalloendopeptidase family protein [Gammaproteobacteria bacterium]
MLPPGVAQSTDSDGIASVARSGHAVSASSTQEDAAALRAVNRAVDSDGDGLEDFADNCSDIANANQRDSNSDGYGNACDPDLNNNGTVSFPDVAIFKAAFLTSPGDTNWNPDADFDGDDLVGFSDLAVMKNLFLSPPGPSGMSCAGTVPCPEPRLIFAWPMPGADADDWVINNYVDLDPGAGILDYLGGAKSYDGHRGVDIDVPTFRAMDNDFPILAVAQGTVLDLEDGNFDRNTSCVGSWNFVTVGHPNGWKTIYGHLKMNSVVVSVGQIVEAGDVLGVVGSSGCSTAPHLHLQTHDENNVVRSPFLEGMWSNPPVYNTPIGFMDAALYNATINNANMIKDPPPNATIVPPGGTFGIGLSMGGGALGDSVNLRILSGAGLVAQNTTNWPGVLRHSFWWWNYGFATGASGPHELEIRVNGNLVEIYNFTVAPILTGFQQVRHGVPAASYQALFNDLVTNGYRPVWVDGYDVNGSTFFNVIFDQSVVASWAAAHGQDNTQYQNFFNAQVQAGRRLVHIDSYLEGGQMRHASVFADEIGTAWASYHGATVADHLTLFNNFVGQGFRARIISSVQEGGTQRITALYDKNPVGGWVALANLSSAQYQ